VIKSCLLSPSWSFSRNLRYLKEGQQRQTRIPALEAHEVLDRELRDLPEKFVFLGVFDPAARLAEFVLEVDLPERVGAVEVADLLDCAVEDFLDLVRVVLEEVDRPVGEDDPESHVVRDARDCQVQAEG
jgi:hypothetical protein